MKFKRHGQDSPYWPRTLPIFGILLQEALLMFELSYLTHLHPNHHLFSSNLLQLRHTAPALCPCSPKNRTSDGDQPAFRRARSAGKFPILIPSALLFPLVRAGQRHKLGFIAKRCLAQVLKEILVNIPHVHETETKAFAEERPRRPLRRGWLLGYIGVVVLFILAVIFQVFLAGAGILVAGRWFTFHAAFGNLIILFPLLLLLPCGLIARLPRSLNWLTALLALLAL